MEPIVARYRTDDPALGPVLLHAWVRSGPRLRLRMYLYPPLAAVIAIAGAAQLVLGHAPPGVWYVALVFGIPFYLVALSGYTRWWLGRRVARQAAAKLALVWRFETETMTVTSAEDSSTLAWSAVERVVELDDALTLRFPGRVMLVLPRLAFASDADYDAVRARLREVVG